MATTTEVDQRQIELSPRPFIRYCLTSAINELRRDTAFHGQCCCDLCAAADHVWEALLDLAEEPT